MRSVPRGSYSRLCQPEVLWQAWTAYARAKGRKPAVARFSIDADRRVFALHRALVDRNYRPGRFYQLVVRDPKLRLISTPSLTDRVLHQAIVSELGPHYNRSLITHSYACRRGLGPQRGVLQFLAWTRSYPFRLHIDMHRYFPSIDHAVLCQLLFRRLRDVPTKNLLAQLISAGGRVYATPLARQLLGVPEPNCGAPIGSSLSQWVANLYLDGLDHHVKRVLKIPAYLRYMDDAVLFANDRGQLVDALHTLEAWLWQHRRLRLNPKHRHVHLAASPCTFLGYRISRAGIRPGAKMRRRFRNKVRAAARQNPEKLVRTIQAYQALMCFG